MSEHPAPRLTCREVVELLTAHLDGALPPAIHARVDAHLETCPDCVTYVEQLRATIHAVGRTREDDVPEEMLTALADAFRQWRDG